MMFTRPGAATTQRGGRPNRACEFRGRGPRQHVVPAYHDSATERAPFAFRSYVYFSNILSTGTTLTFSFSIGTGNLSMSLSSATISGGVPACRR